MSTEHTLSEITDREDKKHVMILDYNSYKGGVDTVDQMLNTYPISLFFGIWPCLMSQGLRLLLFGLNYFPTGNRIDTEDVRRFYTKY